MTDAEGVADVVVVEESIAGDDYANVAAGEKSASAETELICARRSHFAQLNSNLGLA